MTDLYTCACGNQCWEIFDTGVRCTTCKEEYLVAHMPVTEFNQMVTENLQETFEEGLGG